MREWKSMDPAKQIEFCRWLLHIDELIGWTLHSPLMRHVFGWVDMWTCRTSATGQLRIHMWKWRFLCIPKTSKFGMPYLASVSLVIFLTSSIDTAHYCEIIEQFLALLELEERYCWVQQDNATAHTSNSTRTFLWHLSSMIASFLEDCGLPGHWIYHP